MNGCLGFLIVRGAYFVGAVGSLTLSDEQLLEAESKGCFDFFWNEANHDPASPGYGLIRDRAPGNPQVCSVAAVGFGLTALVIGVERGWVSREDAGTRALGTLKTLLCHAEQVHGFFYHFLHMRTAKRYWNCEVSVIDTALAVCGALTAGEYFGGEVAEKAREIYTRVQWPWYVDPVDQRFYMGYFPEKGFFGKWDMYAEQLMMYFLAAGSPTHPASPEMFYHFARTTEGCGGAEPIIYSYFGSIFTYQFSHAWFDLRNRKDRKGVDWWANSVMASRAGRQYCMDHAGRFKTYGPESWGLTACDGPHGYNGVYGAPPRALRGIHEGNDGTVPPCGAAGSIVFTPREAMDALLHYYDKYPELWGRYGFRDAYNLDVKPAWFASDVIGIDKGVTLLMIENYRSGLVWEVFMRNDCAVRGMELAGVKRAA